MTDWVCCPRWETWSKERAKPGHKVPAFFTCREQGKWVCRLLTDPAVGTGVNFPQSFWI